MNNRTRFGSKSILKRRAYYILSVWKINADVEAERGKNGSHTLIRITALDSILKKVFQKNNCLIYLIILKAYFKILF